MVEVLTPSPRGAICREQAACLVLVCISPWHPGLGPDCCRGWEGLRDFPACLMHMGEVKRRSSEGRSDEALAGISVITYPWGAHITRKRCPSMEALALRSNPCSHSLVWACTATSISTIDLHWASPAVPAKTTRIRTGPPRGNRRTESFLDTPHPTPCPQS